MQWMEVKAVKNMFPLFSGQILYWIISCLAVLALDLTKLLCFPRGSSPMAVQAVWCLSLSWSQPKHYVNPVLLLGFCTFFYLFLFCWVVQTLKPNGPGYSVRNTAVYVFTDKIVNAFLFFFLVHFLVVAGLTFWNVLFKLIFVEHSDFLRESCKTAFL